MSNRICRRLIVHGLPYATPGRGVPRSIDDCYESLVWGEGPVSLGPILYAPQAYTPIVLNLLLPRMHHPSFGPTKDSSPRQCGVGVRAEDVRDFALMKVSARSNPMQAAT